VKQRSCFICEVQKAHPGRDGLFVLFVLFVGFVGFVGVEFICEAEWAWL
jgi:hypothetical protein